MYVKATTEKQNSGNNLRQNVADRRMIVYNYIKLMRDCAFR